MGAKAAAVVRIGVGSKKWADKLRKRSREIVKQMDVAYVELAELLYLAHDVPVDNDPKGPPTYTRWGYTTFGSYAEDALGLQRRKAERLRSIGRLLNIELAGLNPALKQRLTELGWTKLTELVRIFMNKHDRKTVEKWVEFAEKNTYEQTWRAVGKAIDKMGVKNGEVVDDVTESVIDEDAEEEDESVLEDGDEDEGHYGAGRLTVKDAADALPPPERTKMFNFFCTDEQIDVVAAALERAAELGADRASKSMRLSLICTDFLATNTFGKPDDPKARVSYLRKLEKFLGCRLIAVDKDNDVFYGFKSLKKIADK
jgi:hypothetical protein